MGASSSRRSCRCSSWARCTFFFCRSSTYRDLHSFPTRRSSDLDSDLPGRDRRRGGLVRRRRTSPRSEEHTSELQSPYDLVCRLLLEKKNQSQLVSPERLRLAAAVLVLSPFLPMIFMGEEYGETA